MEFSEDFCAGPAFSNAATLSLIPGGGGAPRHFFSYQENDGDPVISWAAENQLVVKIDRLDEIYLQESEIKGISIRYEIGEVSVNNPR